MPGTYLKTTAVPLLLLCLCASGEAEVEILTWEDCVAESARTHPDLVSAGEQLKQAEAGMGATKSGLLPQLTGSASSANSKASTGAETESYSYRVTGRQLLFDASGTSHKVDAASENIRSAKYNYDLVSSNVRSRLRSAFVQLLRAQELLNITGDIAGRRKQNVELVKLRYEAGREHKGALLAAEADSAQAEFEVAQAARNISVSQRKLTKELGRRELSPIQAKGDLDIKDPGSQKPSFQSMADETPLLRQLAARTKAAEYGLESAKAEYYPKAYANASTGASESSFPPEGNEWTLGLSLSFPLFEGGRLKAQVSGATAAFGQAKADEESRREGVVLTLEESWTRLQDAVDRIKVQRKFLDAAGERANIAQAQYSSGLISFDDWTIIEDSLVRAKKSFLDVQADALAAEAEWVQAKGGTLDEE